MRAPIVGMVGLASLLVAGAAAARAPAAPPPAARAPVGQAPSPASGSRQTVAPPSGTQRALAVAVEPGAIVATVCDAGAARCDASGGARFVPPESARSTAAGGAVRAVRLAGGRHVVLVEATGGDGTWHLVLAAPPNGDAEARVVWSGWTGRPLGTEGDRRENRLVVEPAGGGSRVVVSSRRDDLSLCGRGAWTAPRAVDPATLELAPIAAADPLAGARTGAGAPDPIAAVVVPAGETRGAPARLLAPLAGSRPGFASLVDGDPATAWAIDAVGDGSFETATFVGTPELPIQAIEVRLAPPAGKDRAAARGLVIATPERLLRLTMPDVPVPAGGLVVRATIPAPIAARCVAVVVESPAGRGMPAALVTEIGARTALDAMSLEQVARGLGSADGSARAAYLARAGDPGLAAALAAYPTLDGPGQDMARRVIDAAPCPKKLPFYVAQLGEREETVAARAIDRVARCGDDAVEPLLAALAAAPPARVPVLADALGLAAPERAVPELVSRLGTAPDDATRAAIRTALSRASRRGRAGAALARVLEPQTFAGLPEVARIDVLRAAAPRLATTPGGPAALASVVQAGDFRARYLVAPASAELSRGGDPAARSWMERTMTSELDGRLRARAVRAAARAPALLPVIARASADPEPRVREAAALALALIGESRGVEPAPGGRSAAPGAAPGTAARPVAEVDAALVRGVRDEWTYVREAAAVAAATWPSEARADAAIAAAAAEDRVPRVRRAAIAALGARGAVGHVALVRARAAASREDLDVRAEAVRALGALCDRASLGSLSELAARAAAPFNEADRKLGGAAIEALAALHPPDLAARLAPLRAKDAPREARERAERAMAQPGRCR